MSGIPGKFAKVDPMLWYLVEARLTVNNYDIFFYLPDFVNIVYYTSIYISLPNDLQALGIFYTFYIL